MAVEFLPAGGGREVETFRRKDDKGNVLADEGGEQWKLQQFTGEEGRGGKVVKIKLRLINQTVVMGPLTHRNLKLLGNLVNAFVDLAPPTSGRCSNEGVYLRFGWTVTS